MKDDPKDFWNPDDLVPPRKSAPFQERFFADTSAVEITASAPDRADHPRGNVCETGGVFADADVPLRERPVNPYAGNSAPKVKPEAVYRPEHSLIREVRIYPWHSAYNYYELFRTHAEKLNPREGSACAEVDFFSYMPQYTQLTREQLRYYLWWRTNFRRGIFLPASFSYLLLYLYEQINLSDKVPPGEGQENILRLWLNYRGEHPRLDAMVREWLCDYSLLHRLPPPALPRTLWNELISGCRLKEFYVSGWRGTEDEVLAILLFCNNYDYKKSKFYRADTAKLYDRVLSGAVAVALSFLREKGKDRNSGAGISTVTRDAFAGAVCSYRLKRRIEVDFSSFSHTHELRYIMTDVLKYAENAIRARISVKSRLTVYQISTELRRVLDAYLETALPQKAPIRYEKKPQPDYEKQYDVPARPISLERAARIEAESWETTKKLVEAFGGGCAAEPEGEVTVAVMKDPSDIAQNPQNFLDSRKAGEVFSSRVGTNSENRVKEAPQEVKEALQKLKEAPQDVKEVSATAGEAAAPAAENTREKKKREGGTQPATLAEALGEWAEFVRLAAAGDRAGERRFAESRGEMVDAVADRVNTLAGELFGDVILEDAGGFYTVIADYADDLRKEGILF